MASYIKKIQKTDCYAHGNSKKFVFHTDSGRGWRLSKKLERFSNDEILVEIEYEEGENNTKHIGINKYCWRIYER